MAEGKGRRADVLTHMSLLMCMDSESPQSYATWHLRRKPLRHPQLQPSALRPFPSAIPSALRHSPCVPAPSSAPPLSSAASAGLGVNWQRPTLAARRVAEGLIRADYTGFTIPDAFVVGYGLDHNGRWRGLPDLCVIETP